MFAIPFYSAFDRLSPERLIFQFHRLVRFLFILFYIDVRHPRAIERRNHLSCGRRLVFARVPASRGFACHIRKAVNNEK